MHDNAAIYGFAPIPMLILGFALGLLLIIPFWRLFSRVGYSGWWSALMIVPFVHLIVLYVLAFSDWPALKKPHS